MKRFAFLLLVVCCGVSCVKDKPDPDDYQAPPAVLSRGVFVANEGNFQWGNATVSYHDIPTGLTTADLFQPANQRPLGDVCQSITFVGYKAYLVVNNSGKVEVVNAGNFSSIATITGFVSPRYLLPVSDRKAYVTDLYSDKISIVDLASNAVTGQIACPGWTEELVFTAGQVYVTNSERDKVYVIDPVSDQLSDSITVSYGGNSLRTDAQGKVWVLCGGNASAGIQSALYCINPANNQVEKNLSFSTSGAWRLQLNAAGDTLYYLHRDVYRMPVSATALPSSPFISEGSRNLYSLGLDPLNGDVYVADAIDYVQQGRIYRYSSTGELITSFYAGIIPGQITVR